MLKGLRLIIAGVLVTGMGIALAAAPDKTGLDWYVPLPAFPAGALLVWVGVYFLRSPKGVQGPADTAPQPAPGPAGPGAARPAGRGAGSAWRDAAEFLDGLSAPARVMAAALLSVFVAYFLRRVAGPDSLTFVRVVLIFGG